MANTRLRRRAQPHRDETGLAEASIPCWRGVGVMDLRSLQSAIPNPQVDAFKRFSYFNLEQ